MDAREQKLLTRKYSSIKMNDDIFNLVKSVAENFSLKGGPFNLEQLVEEELLAYDDAFDIEKAVAKKILSEGKITLQNLVMNDFFSFDVLLWLCAKNLLESLYSKSPPLITGSSILIGSLLYRNSAFKEIRKKHDKCFYTFIGQLFVMEQIFNGLKPMFSHEQDAVMQDLIRNYRIEINDYKNDYTIFKFNYDLKAVDKNILQIKFQSLVNSFIAYADSLEQRAKIPTEVYGMQLEKAFDKLLEEPKWCSYFSEEHLHDLKRALNESKSIFLEDIRTLIPSCFATAVVKISVMETKLKTQRANKKSGDKLQVSPSSSRKSSNQERFLPDSPRLKHATTLFTDRDRLNLKRNPGAEERKVKLSK